MREPNVIVIPVEGLLGTKAPVEPITVILDAPCDPCGGTGRSPDGEQSETATIGGITVRIDFPNPCRCCDGKGWIPTDAGHAILNFLGDHARIGR